MGNQFEVEISTSQVESTTPKGSGLVVGKTHPFQRVPKISQKTHPQKEAVPSEPTIPFSGANLLLVSREGR